MIPTFAIAVDRNLRFDAGVVDLSQLLEGFREPKSVAFLQQRSTGGALRRT